MAKTVVNLSDQMAVFVQKANLISTHVGDLVTLTTANDSDLVGAINELDSAQGNIASLNTTNKSSLVAAVNEVKQQASNTDSDLSGFLRSNVNDVMTAGSIRFDDMIPLVIGTDSDFTLTHTGGTTTAAGNITFTGAMVVSNQFTSDSATINGPLVANGLVGIGTATPTLDGSLAGLSVNGSGTVLHVNDGDGATVKLTDPATGANRGLGITLQGTNAAISNCESGELRFGTGNIERMRIDAGGAVQVKSSSATTPTYSHSNFGEGILFRYNDDAGVRAADIVAIGNTPAGASMNMRFHVSQSGANPVVERMRIDDLGRVTVGHTSAINIGMLGVSNRASGTSRMVAVHNAAGTVGFFNQVAFRNNGDTANIGEIVRVNDASVQYNTTSDKRLKDNIETLQNGTELLEEMRPVTFNWKTDGSSDTGFVAQEMLEVMPTAVNPGETEDDMMSMDYGRITPIIVAALQEANKKIEELQNRIEELEAK